MGEVVAKNGVQQEDGEGGSEGGERDGRIRDADVYQQQGIEQVRQFVGHVRQQDEIGKLMLIELEWLQLCVGSEKPVWELDWKKHSYVEERGWVTLLW